MYSTSLFLKPAQICLKLSINSLVLALKNINVERNDLFFCPYG